MFFTIYILWYYIYTYIIWYNTIYIYSDTLYIYTYVYYDTIYIWWYYNILYIIYIYIHILRFSSFTPGDRPKCSSRARRVMTMIRSKCWPQRCWLGAETVLFMGIIPYTPKWSQMVKYFKGEETLNHGIGDEMRINMG